MLVFNLLKTSVWLILVVTTVACSYLWHVNVNSKQVHLLSKATMPSSVNAVLKSVTLLAREEKTPPLGVPANANRSIGFASVFLRLENPKEKDVSLTVQRVEIRNTVDGNVQLSDSSPQQIHLRPLENSEIVFHLTNKIGYSQHNQVKAVINYTIGDRTQLIESTPVEVQRL
jgi:hypothetical protein